MNSWFEQMREICMFWNNFLLFQSLCIQISRYKIKCLNVQVHVQNPRYLVTRNFIKWYQVWVFTKMNAIDFSTIW